LSSFLLIVYFKIWQLSVELEQMLTVLEFFISLNLLSYCGSSGEVFPARCVCELKIGGA